MRDQDVDGGGADDAVGIGGGAGGGYGRPAFEDHRLLGHRRETPRATHEPQTHSRLPPAETCSRVPHLQRTVTKSGFMKVARYVFINVRTCAALSEQRKRETIFSTCYRIIRPPVTRCLSPTAKSDNSPVRPEKTDRCEACGRRSSGASRAGK